MTALQGEKTTFRGWGKFTEVSGELCSAADGREDLLIFELCLDFHHMDSETMHNRSKFAPITSCLRYTWCFNQSKNRHLWKVKMDGTEGWSWILYRKRVKVRLEISRINVSLSKHKRRWSERFEQNEVKEMKRFPDTEMVTIPGYSLKGLRRKKKTLMFVVPVHKPFTSGKRSGFNVKPILWELPFNHQVTNNKTFLPDLQGSCQETKPSEFITETVVVGTWESACSNKNGDLSYSSFSFPPFFPLFFLPYIPTFCLFTPSFSPFFHLSLSALFHLRLLCFSRKLSLVG